jgi:uncharacterized protein
MDWAIERRWLALTIFGFAAIYALPLTTLAWLDWRPVAFAVYEGAALLQWYAREHVILCLLPAFLVAGGMAVYIPQAVVLKHLGAEANRWVALGVASVSGTVLAVCSCTVLPLFGGLYKRGAGIGPAVAFLYTGPAINVIAIVMTAKVLGAQLGIARAVAAVVFAIVIGLVMHLIFGRRTAMAPGSRPCPTPTSGRPGARPVRGDDGGPGLRQLGHGECRGPVRLGGGRRPQVVARRRLRGTGRGRAGGRLWLAARPAPGRGRPRRAARTPRPARAATRFPGRTRSASSSSALRSGDDAQDWMAETWSFAKQIMPLLLAGVFVAGMLLGRPGEEGLIPPGWIARAVGGESLAANLFASVVGSLMYFATLTEVPIVQALRGAGMGEGPSLALLLAGPALSLPNMLAIRSIMGTARTAVYVALVVVMATLSGLIYGSIFG